MTRLGYLYSTLLLVAGLALACNPPPKGHSGWEDDLTYFQDCHTRLCFAQGGSLYQGFMAHVPCDKVQNVLRNQCPMTFGGN